MASSGADPYRILGVSAGVSDADLRAAHRRLAKLHHPDHNGGSAESARRFAEVQEAFATIAGQRRAAGGGGGAAPSGDSDATVADRLAQLERQLAAERAIRADQARQTALDAAAAAATGSNAAAERPSDEELGYIRTEDTLGSIFADARDELGKLFDEARRRAGER